MSNLVLGILTLAVPAVALGAYAILFPGVVGRRSLRDDMFVSYLHKSSDNFSSFDLSGVALPELLRGRISPRVLQWMLKDSFRLMMMRESLSDRREEPRKAFVWWRRDEDSPVGWEFRENELERDLHGDVPTPDDLPRRDEIAAAFLAAVRGVHTSSESLALPRQVARSIAEQTCRKLEEADPLAFAFMVQVLARFLHEHSERERRFKGRPSASE